MYLVLTALLALQIKDTVLEKFVLIENGLKESNISLSAYNNAIVEDIQADAVNQGNKDGDLAVAKAAENLRKYTNGIIQEMEDLKVELGKVSSGSENPDDAYTRSVLKKYEPQSNVMVNQKRGEELQAQLDAYSGQVNALFGDLGKDPMPAQWSESLAKKAEDIEFYANNKEALKEDYTHFNFYKAPLASVLAQLTFYQNQLYSKESEALNELGDLIGSVSGISPSDISDLGGLTPMQGSTNDEQPEDTTPVDDGGGNATPITSPNTPTSIDAANMLERPFQGIDYAEATILSPNNTVTAGLEFNAEAVLTLGNSALQPNIKLNGQDIDVINGRGVINFKASARANEYNAQDLAEKSFEIEIEAADGSGGTITRTTTHTYNVARPVIVTKAKAIEKLYRDCANPVTIEVPSLGPAYNPSFQMTGATYTQGAGKGEVNIAPSGGDATVQVSSSGIYIGSKTFEVRSAPVPEISVLVNGQPYDPELGFSGRPNELSFNYDVDPEFKAGYANDARWLVSKGVILVQRGTTVTGRINIDSPNNLFNMTQYANLLTAGSTIIVKVEEIVRINFERKQIRTPKFANATIRIN